MGKWENEEVKSPGSIRSYECPHELQSDFSDIDEFDLTLSSEGLDLLRKSGSRKKPKTKVVSWPFRRKENTDEDVHAECVLR